MSAISLKAETKIKGIGNPTTLVRASRALIPDIGFVARCCGIHHTLCHPASARRFGRFMGFAVSNTLRAATADGPSELVFRGDAALDAGGVVRPAAGPCVGCLA
jgi:hypothetical protein